MFQFAGQQLSLVPLLHQNSDFNIHICAVRSRLLHASRSLPTKSYSDKQPTHYQNFCKVTLSQRSVACSIFY